MKYYFLGICGTAMASLAILLKQKGHEVWGSDQNVYPPMSDLLASENIPVFNGYSVENLNKKFDTAIIGNALSRGNVEVEQILSDHLPFASITEIIRKEFTQPLSSIVVTGTHGKTTTSSLMAHVLETAGLAPGFLIGGIVENFGTSAQVGNGKHFVIEGDEYDSAFFDKRPKFLNYFPDALIINNIEFDHSDIYDNIDQIKDGFRKLMRIIPQNGIVLANGEDTNVLDVINPAYCPVATFGSSDKNNWQYTNISDVPGGSEFDIFKDSEFFGRFFLSLSGEFQVSNALAVCGIAHHLKISKEKIAEAFGSFKSVARRLDDWGKWEHLQVYDDFAHHPTAIKKTLQAIRTKYPEKSIAVLFEPRTNTTVKNYFQAELAEALSIADNCLITPIHRPERIPANNRLSLPQLKSDLNNGKCSCHLIADFSDLIGDLAEQTAKNDILVIMTNGNLGGYYAEIKNIITGKSKTPPEGGSGKRRKLNPQVGLKY